MAALWLLQAVDPSREIGSISSELVDYVKLILTLALVLVLAFVGLRFWLPRITGLRNIASGPIRVVARYPLEPRKNLYIVRAGGGYFMVGTSETGVHYLNSLDSSQVEASLAQEEPAGSNEFGNLLKAFKRSKRST